MARALRILDDKHRARCAVFSRARHAAARVAPMRGPGRLHIMSRGGAPPASATTEAGITRSHPEPGS